MSALANPYALQFTPAGARYSASVLGDLLSNSYSPYFADPQTTYGSCDCRGGALRYNNCNYQQGGYRPQCLAGGRNCRCVSPNGKDFGCFNQTGANCV